MTYLVSSVTQITVYSGNMIVDKLSSSKNPQQRKGDYEITVVSFLHGRNYGKYQKQSKPTLEIRAET